MSENNTPAGHPMNEIARQFQSPAPPGEGQSPSSSHAHDDRSTDRIDRSDGSNDQAPDAWFPDTPLALKPSQIAAPAFFVDQGLAVQWVAPGGNDALTAALEAEMCSGSDRNVFDMLLRPEVKAASADWKGLFSFVYVFLRRSTTREVFDSQAASIAHQQRPQVADEAVADAEGGLFTLASHRLGGANRIGRLPALRVFGLRFNQGTLFVLKTDSWNDPDAGIQTGTPSTGTGVDRPDRKPCVAVLSVRLNDSHRISETMLPEIFFRMMNLLWDAVDDIATALGGKRLGSSGAHNHYVFQTSAGRDPIFSAICCATRINGRMASLEQTISDDLGWADEVCMNMGIGHGRADTDQTDADAAMTLKIPGGAFDQASLLSSVAGKADIWITKHAIAQLPKRLLDQVIFGIERKGQFRRNFFTRIEDMQVDRQTVPSRPDLLGIAIARVLEIQPS